MQSSDFQAVRRGVRVADGADEFRRSIAASVAGFATGSKATAGSLALAADSVESS